jgi:hypothetical protein
MVRGNVLRLYETQAVFESLDTGSCLIASQIKEGCSHDLKLCDRLQLPDLGGPSQVMPIEAIFGFYELLSGSYVALVVESEPFVSASNIYMRRAKKFLVVPLFRNGRSLSESKQLDEDKYLQLFHMAFSEHNFFFSDKYDVTLSQQSYSKLTPKQLNEKLWTRADHRFFWNREVVSDLIACEADEWIVPFMSAYVEVRPDCEIEGHKFTLLFISRRSRYRQGCRFTRRGIDENGHAANFVETEQILLHNNGMISSYVQIRGSIPVQWSSTVHMRYDPAVIISDDIIKTTKWSESHANDICNIYSDNVGCSGIVYINLVDNKKDQGRLGVAFKQTIDEVKKKITVYSLEYVWFDFHHECRQKGKWNNLSKLVFQVDNSFRDQNFFCKNSHGTVISWQKGVLRTNCMDNLDRTNVVQSLFARRSLIMQLNLAVEKDINSNNKFEKLLENQNVLDTPWRNFENIYKSVWANNADAISLLYAGTGALKVDFTKTGKRTYKGMFNDGINSCKRYYINNFTDGVKQDTIDLMLGNYCPDPSLPSPFTIRPGQETLSNTIYKIFVLMVIIFSILLLIIPDSFHIQNENVIINQLRSNVYISFCITSLIVMYICFKVIKKGSKIGARLVVHPSLIHESFIQKK